MSNKIVWYVVAAVAIAIPIVPDKYKISINVSPPTSTQPKTTNKNPIVASCTLVRESTTPQGMHVCEYKCEGSTSSLYKTSMTNNYVCEKKIKERIRPGK
jgi:hypothetical protein